MSSFKKWWPAFAKFSERNQDLTYTFAIIGYCFAGQVLRYLIRVLLSNVQVLPGGRPLLNLQSKIGVVIDLDQDLIFIAVYYKTKARFNIKIRQKLGIGNWCNLRYSHSQLTSSQISEQHLQKSQLSEGSKQDSLTKTKSYSVNIHIFWDSLTFNTGANRTFIQKSFQKTFKRNTMWRQILQQLILSRK